MKKLLICLALLALTACIPVDDFGAYWDKGTVDKAMVGDWKETTPGVKDPGLVRLADKMGTYRLDSLKKEDRREKTYTPLFAKTLAVGPYTFLMTTTGAGDAGERNLVRYVIRGGKLTDYTLSETRMAVFLRRNYPHAWNISAPECRPKCLFESVKIRTLDREVVAILANIPDTPDFWKPASVWQKLKGKPAVKK